MVGTDSSKRTHVDEGKIIFVDRERGMLNTKTAMALTFTRDQCAGFDPADGNLVAIGRIEGMQAYELSLLSVTPASMTSVDGSRVDELW